MSHGSIDKCEPNLTPLLDLVLQMIMFFMLCGNFIAEDVNASIRLPSAIQAKPLDKSEDYVIFLNVDRDGNILLSAQKGGEVLGNATQLQGYMKDKARLDKARIDKAKAAGKKEQRLSLVVIRADKATPFVKVNEVLDVCRNNGYSDVQLRAIVGSGN